MINKKLFIISLIFLNILNYLDLFLTLIGINNYGLIIESNPLIKFVVSNLGYIPLIIIKIIVVFIVSMILYYSEKSINNKFYTTISTIILIALNCVFTSIIFSWLGFLIG